MTQKGLNLNEVHDLFKENPKIYMDCIEHMNKDELISISTYAYGLFQSLYGKKRW